MNLTRWTLINLTPEQVLYTIQEESLDIEEQIIPSFSSSPSISFLDLYSTNNFLGLSFNGSHPWNELSLFWSSCPRLHNSICFGYLSRMDRVSLDKQTKGGCNVGGIFRSVFGGWKQHAKYPSAPPEYSFFAQITRAFTSWLWIFLWMLFTHLLLLPKT